MTAASERIYRSATRGRPRARPAPAFAARIEDGSLVDDLRQDVDAERIDDGTGPDHRALNDRKKEPSASGSCPDAASRAATSASCRV
jgi:hypothetical protein